jgi:hypothetical protein
LRVGYERGKRDPSTRRRSRNVPFGSRESKRAQKLQLENHFEKRESIAMGIHSPPITASEWTARRRLLTEQLQEQPWGNPSLDEGARSHASCLRIDVSSKELDKEINVRSHNEDREKNVQDPR